MDPRELIAFLRRIRCWIPKSNEALRNDIDIMIERLKNLMR